MLLLFDKSLILGCLWPLVFVLNNTLILGIWCSTIPHLLGCFCPWTFFENIGFNTVLTDPFMSHLATQLGYSAGFATDCPCGVWCRGLTICLLHVGPPFGNRILNKSWAVGFDIMDNISYFFVFWHMQLYVLIHQIFFGFTFSNILYFFKYSCTNIFHRRSLYTFY